MIPGFLYPHLLEIAAERAGPSPDAVHERWLLIARARVLADRGQHEGSIRWFNAALAAGSGKTPDTDIFAAELFAFAGMSLSASGELGDADFSLREATRRWRHLGEAALAGLRTPESDDAVLLMRQLRDMGAELDPDGVFIPRRPELWEGKTLLANTRWLIGTWARERVVYIRGAIGAAYAGVLADLHETPEALAACRDVLQWLEDHWGTAEADDARYWLLMKRGDIESKLQESVEASIATFAAAAEIWRDHVVNAQDLQRVLIAEANQANSLVAARRFDEARELYRTALEGFESVGDHAAAGAVRYAQQYAARQQPDAPASGGDLRATIRAWEARLRDQPDRRNLFIHKQQIQPAYQALLAETAQGGGSGAGDYLRLVRALREPEGLADLPPDTPDEHDVPDPLAVLDAHLRPLDDTLVLVAQGAVGGMTLLALAGGGAPLEERLWVGVVDDAFAEHAATLLVSQSADVIGVSSGRIPADHPAGDELANAGAALWETLPERVRRLILANRVILYLPDPFGVLDEVPLELLRHDGGWLGLSHVIARVPSHRVLAELLSPNRLPNVVDDRAYVLRAEDPVGFDALPSADAEAQRATRWLRALQLAPELHAAVARDELRDALDDGFRVLHYVGHGVADRLSGETLPLSDDESLEASDLGQLLGYRTPFVYLSACEVGRARTVRGGRQRGIATQLLEHGAPAVIAYLQTVPDRVATRIAAAFYREAAEAPIGLAMLRARRRLDADGLAPSCWALCVLGGDPGLTISPRLGPMRRTGDAVASWGSALVRYMASVDPRHLDCARTRLRASGSPAPDDAAGVAHWLEDPFGSAGDAALAERVRASDLLGGSALQLLLALRRGTLSDLLAGATLAGAIEDRLAYTIFTAAIAQAGAGHVAMNVLSLYARDAESSAAGWAASAPEFIHLREQAEIGKAFIDAVADPFSAP